MLDREYGAIYLGFMLLLGPSDRRFAAGMVADDAEALIEEARRRARRRWWRRGVAFAGLVVAAAAVVAYGVSGGGAGVVAQTAARPFANLSAFAGRGELAFVSRGGLWVLDGQRGSLRRLTVPRGWTPSSPEFSRDGRWLAYLTAASTTGFPTQVELWLARGDGSGARVVRNLDINQPVGWSPNSDMLAVIGGSTGSTLEVIQPAGRSTVLVALSGDAARYGSLESAAWSPDGREIAVSTVDFRGPTHGTTIRAYPVAGGAPTTWFRIRNDQPFPAHICSRCGHGTETIADVIGWWPRWGIAFWVYCCGAVHDNDGSQVAILSRPGGRPRFLARTLSSRATDAITAGAGGSLALVADALNNGGREIGSGKTVETCNSTSYLCTPLPGARTWVGTDHQRCAVPTQTAKQCLGSAVPPAGRPGSGVSLDPSWSTSGDRLAYIRAPVALTGGWPDSAWYAAHGLYVWNARTGATRRISAVDGASVPTWSADGHELLYVHDDGLWLAPIDRGTPIEIAFPLFHPSGLYTSFTHDYYGQIPWNAQFSWARP